MRQLSGWRLGCWLLAGFCWLGHLTGAQAAVFKYVDALGVISYTDDFGRAAPFNPEELELWEPRADQVKLRYTASGHLFIINELHGPVTVWLQLSQREGVESERDLAKPILVPARSEVYVTRLRFHGTGHLQLSQHFVLGSPSSGQAARLLPPFRGRFRVSQGFEGRYSHKLPGNRFALDIAMPEGTPVLAARDGIVLDEASGFDGHSQDPAARRRTNYVRLLHSDGTMTLYAHLRSHSVRVMPGQRVRAGEHLADSGNTGYSTGPHLHFAVQRNDGRRLVAIPFTLMGAEPRQGEWLGFH